MAVPLAPAVPARAFTIHDLFEMPDDGYRYEVLDGALIVSPAPNMFHQYVGDEVRLILKLAAPAGVHVLTAIAVRIGEDTTTFIPDVVVTMVDPRSRRNWVEAPEVLAVVEIVSPRSKRQDRILKPDVYASAGVPCYWRVELDPEPRVFVYLLEDGAYRLANELPAGEVGSTDHPFPVQFDPGAW